MSANFPDGSPREYETILYEKRADHVVAITLNRPERMNAFNTQMCREFEHAWATVRLDDDVHAVVLRAAGERAFSTGDDIKTPTDQATNPFSRIDPGRSLSPKKNNVWKPVVCAVNGMCAGGAFYWTNACDIVICSDDATFFDPHVTFGWAPVFEPIGMSRRVNFGDAIRVALLGNDERMSAQRALAIGLVTEVVAQEDLWARADELATTIAAKPPGATQGTVRAMWASLSMGLDAAESLAMPVVAAGDELTATSDVAAPPPKPAWRLR